MTYEATLFEKVRAVRFDGTNLAEVKHLFKDAYLDGGELVVPDFFFTVEKGHWVVKGHLVACSLSHQQFRRRFNLEKRLQ